MDQINKYIDVCPWLNDYLDKIILTYKYSNHSAMLIYSPLGNGELNLCNTIISWLICNDKYKIDRGCMSCNNCKLLVNNSNPNIFRITNNVSSVYLEDLFSHIEKLHYLTTNIIYIPYIECFDKKNINILVKFIDKKYKNLKFLIISHNVFNTSVTLRQRCFYFYLKKPLKSYFLSWIRKLNLYNSIEIEYVVKICNNNPLASLKLLRSNFIEKRNTVLSIFKDAFLNKDFLSLLPILNQKKNIYEHPIYWLITLMLDTIKWSYNIKKSLINLDRLDLILIIMNKISCKDLFQQILQLSKILTYFHKNMVIDYELLITYCLLDLQNNTI